VWNAFLLVGAVIFTFLSQAAFAFFIFWQVWIFDKFGSVDPPDRFHSFVFEAVLLERLQNGGLTRRKRCEIRFWGWGASFSPFCHSQHLHISFFDKFGSVDPPDRFRSFFEAAPACKVTKWRVDEKQTVEISTKIDFWTSTKIIAKIIAFWIVHK